MLPSPTTPTATPDDSKKGSYHNKDPQIKVVGVPVYKKVYVDKPYEVKVPKPYEVKKVVEVPTPVKVRAIIQLGWLLLKAPAVCLHLKA